MKEKRNLTDRFIIILLPIIMAAVILPAIKTKAAYAGNADAIGTYNEETGGESTTGVKISKNGNTVCYALDTWRKKSDGEWDYMGSNIDNSIGEITSSPNSPVYIKDTTGTRFGINIGKIWEYLPEKGSIVIKKYVYGKCTYDRAEFTYQDNKNNRVDISKSILKHIESGISSMDLEDTTYGYNGASYLYNIYDAAVISRNGDIKADIPFDCTILSEGYAYYGIESEYLIREFPQIEHDPEEGCTFTFKGWYTSPSGGNEISIGDAIEPGTTIYPQWDRVLNTYNVNCIDILGDNPGGQVLSKNSWTAQYDSEVNGAELGSDSAAGAYYKGLCYTSSTSATVKSDCDVYRYFRPVSYNIIFNGNNAVSGETESLYGCLYGEKYKLTENGYKRNGNIILDLNAENAICTIKDINIPYKFTGWSDTPDGSVIYADGTEVSNLCETDGEKQLYAVWEGSTIEIEEVPIREGYNFNGWSKDKDSTTGSTSFDIWDVDNCTLYAIWKPLKAKYSVEYYLENNKSGYTLDKKTEYEAFTGYEADCSNDLYITEHSNKYILDKDKSIYKGIVKYDGSLLLKCYLKKKTTDDGNTGNSGNTGSTGGNTTGSNTGNSGNAGSTGGNATGSNAGNSGNTGSTVGNATGGNAGNSGNTGNTGGNTTGSNTGNSGNTGSTGGKPTGSNTGNSVNTGSTGGNATGSNTGNSGNTGSTGEKPTGSNTGNNGNNGVISGGSIGSSGNGNNSNSNTGNSNSNGGNSITGGSGSNSTGGNNSAGVVGSGSSSQSGNTGSNNSGHNGAVAGNTTQGSIGNGSNGNVSNGGGDITGPVTGNTGTVEDNEGNNGNNGEDSIVNNGTDYIDSDGTGGNTVVKKSPPKKKMSYPKAGKKYIKSGIIYKIIKSNSKTRTVKVIKAKKSITKAEIPSAIKIKGYKYKVVSIGKNAFVKCKKLKKVIIGKNIKSIRKKAFYKDKKLGSIRIKSKKLKSIGKKAFKRIKPGCVVKIAGNRKYAKKVFSMISAKG